MLYRQSGTEWPVRIQDAIFEKLGKDHGIVHIVVDQNSDEVRISRGPWCLAFQRLSTIIGVVLSSLLTALSQSCSLLGMIV